MTHPFRRQKSQFNGKEEYGKHCRCLRGSKVLSKMESIQIKFGKMVGNKRKRCEDNHESTAWSKRSILFELPYWKVRFNTYINIYANCGLFILHTDIICFPFI